MLQLKAFKREIPDWWREFQFHPTRKWRFDFAFPDAKLAVEIEGGVWSGGRHTRGAGFEKDCEKYANAAILGWRIIRVSPGQVKSGQCLEWILNALKVEGAAKAALLAARGAILSSVGGVSRCPGSRC